MIDICLFDSRVLTVTQNGTSSGVSDANAANNRYFISAPLICTILSGCEKLIPACLMPQMRQILTVDQLTNFVSSTTAVKLFYVYNKHITYNLIDFGSEVQNMVMNMPKFITKSNNGLIRLQRLQC